MTHSTIASSNRRVLVLTSPKAGSGANRHQIPRLMGLLKQAGIEAALTHDPADLSDASDRTVVVAAGGDGTVTLAASRLLAAASSLGIGHQTTAAIVPMPLGTENLLARHFGHLADAQQVLDTIVHGIPHAIDLGQVSSARQSIRPMLTMATCGFDAEVVRHLHLRRQGHIRRSSYFWPISKVIGKYRFPEITVQAISADGAIDRTVHCGWAMVFNLPCYGGGLTIEPDAIGDDGLLDVIAFQGRSVVSGLKYVAGIKTGRHLGFADIVRFRASAVRLESSQRAHYQVDGDYGGRLPIAIGIKPGAVQLLLPRSTA
jgi:diacylglycerol kinase family enzyme